VAPFSTASRCATARPAVGIFSPQRLLLKLDTHGYSPALLHKIIGTAGQVKSHELASRVVKLVGDITISGRHINRLAEEIGTEMQEQRDRETEDYVHHRRQPPQRPAPPVAVLALDGGRIQTRATGQGTGVHQQQWKEDKVACLLALEGPTFAADPHPEPPRCFLDAPRVDEMVRDIQAHHGPRQENELPQLAELGLGRPAVATATATPGPAAAVPAAGAAATPAADTAAGAAATPAAIPAAGVVTPNRDWPPQRTKDGRTCVATLRDSAAFGKMVAAEAYRQHFQGAERGALLGDGGAWIWTLHEKWFSWLTPIADFVHPLTYLYVTATVLASSVPQRWQWYVEWMTACWQGRVRAVIEELERRLEQLGPYPGTGEPPPTEPREVLRRTLTYLRHNEPRMKYPDYRRQGLPVTSSMVESLIKEVNYRVKGTEKFWDNPEGAEAILQVRAALLSDDNRLARHIERRPGSAFRRHHKREPRQAA
jgi:hypothetical protein